VIVPPEVSRCPRRTVANRVAPFPEGGGGTPRAPVFPPPPVGGRNRRSPPPRGRCRGRSPKAVGAPPGRGTPPSPRPRRRPGNPPGGNRRSPPPRGRCRGRSPKAVGAPPGRGTPPSPGREAAGYSPLLRGERQKVSEGEARRRWGTPRAAVSSPSGEVPRAKPEGGGGTPRARDSPLPRPRGGRVLPPPGGETEGLPPERWTGEVPRRSRAAGPGLLPLGGGAEGEARRRCRGRSPKAVGEPPGAAGDSCHTRPVSSSHAGYRDHGRCPRTAGARAGAGHRPPPGRTGHRPRRPRPGPGPHRRRAPHPGGLGGGPPRPPPRTGPPPHHRRPHPRGAPRGRPPLHRRGHRPRPGRAHRRARCGRPTRGGGVVRRVGPGTAAP
jgi:translation initiation factor IF-2